MFGNRASTKPADAESVEVVESEPLRLAKICELQAFRHEALAGSARLRRPQKCAAAMGIWPEPVLSSRKHHGNGRPRLAPAAGAPFACSPHAEL
ncbi:MAG: hypothetical protein ACI8UD_004254 [Planctomycetota bacterium]|jgi:hypothetical protein